MLDAVMSESCRQLGAVRLFGAAQYLEQLKLQRSNISLYRTGRRLSHVFPLLSLTPRYSCHSCMVKVEFDGESRDVFAILVAVGHALLRGNSPPPPPVS